VVPEATAAETIDLVLEKTHMDWAWCATDGKTCDCDGLVRYGSTGQPEYYENGDAWFKVGWCRLTPYAVLGTAQTAHLSFRLEDWDSGSGVG